MKFQWLLAITVLFPVLLQAEPVKYANCLGRTALGEVGSSGYDVFVQAGDQAGEFHAFVLGLGDNRLEQEGFLYDGKVTRNVSKVGDKTKLVFSGKDFSLDVTLVADPQAEGAIAKGTADFVAVDGKTRVKSAVQCLDAKVD